MLNDEIKLVGAVVKPHHAEAWATAGELAVWLEKRGATLICEPQAEAEKYKIKTVEAEEFRTRADLIVVLGGDGTMISAARALGAKAIPVLGINYGSLGYLTEFRIEEMTGALEAIFAGNYKIDRRVMLDVQLRRGLDILESGRILNEVVVGKTALAKIIETEITLDNLFVNSFRSDGFIVATPTGSTAYNLSAGGPIVYPSMDAVLLTPICPFTLSNRPIVVPDTAEINIRLTNANDGASMTLDGQIGFQMRSGDRVSITKSRLNFNLVQPPNRNYFDVLRDKLKWGR